MNLRTLALLAPPVLIVAADSGSGLDKSAMNPKVDPCVDFYQ
jgi:hypothetical protein